MSERSTNTTPRTTIFAQHLHEVLFSLNAGFAVMFSLWAFVHRGVISTSAGYFLLPATRLFSRCAANINLLLHLDRANGTGREITLMILIFVIAIPVLLFLRLISHTKLSRIILDPVGGIAAFAFVPALWLHAYQASWLSNGGLYPFWKFVKLPVIEVPVVCALLLFGRKERLSLRVCALILVLHYAWWSAWMWGDIYHWAPYWWGSPLWVPAAFFPVFPFSGFAWLFYVSQLRGKSEPLRSR